MLFMLDTNACIDLIRKRHPILLERVQQRHPEEICISTVTLSELEYGAAKSADPGKNRLALARFIAPIATVSYDPTVAATYGRVRAELEQKGMPIGPLDTLLAAHALALGATLVTDNDREFRRVTGLSVQNWVKPTAA